jgi:hypothetical protein
MYQLTVPQGATNLRFVSSGGTGDFDLYVKFGSQPTITAFTVKSDGPTTAETISIPAPQAGTYYLLTNGFSAYSGVSLVGAYNTAAPAPTPTPTPTPTPAPTPATGSNNLKALNSGLCLKAATTPLANGTQIVQDTCSTASLAFTEVVNGAGLNLKVTGTNFCVNISGFSSVNGSHPRLLPSRLTPS